MGDEERINPGHTRLRGVLRIAGPLLLLTGFVFLAIGLVSFFSAFGNFGPPRYFWCTFVGMGLLAAGGALSKFAFLGAVMRYQAGEIAPVGKDTFGYLADETQDSAEKLASAIGRGLARAGSSDTQSHIPCRECGRPNDPDANYCDGCGAPVTGSIECPSCREMNDAAARFCDNCGHKLEISP